MGSADHLYIKAEMLRWLDGQDITGDAQIPRDGEDSVRLGGQVVVEPAGHDALHILLDEAATAAPGAARGVETVLGPDIEHDPRALVERGYVHRIRCVRDGATTPTVQIGTQHHGGTDWFDLTDCELAPWGLSTPTVSEIRRLRSTRTPIGISTRQMAASATEAPARPVGAQAVVEDRAEVFAALEEEVADGRSVTRLQRCLDRAEAVSRPSATAEENELMRQVADILLRLRRGVGATSPGRPLPRQPARSLPRGGHASRAGSRTAVKLGSRETWKSWPGGGPVPPAAGPAAAPPSGPAPRSAAAPLPPAVLTAADATRDVLEQAARQGRTVTWAELKKQVPALAALSPGKQRLALTQVDEPGRAAVTPGHARAFLASLITADSGGPHSSYRRLAAQLGHFLPDDRERLLTAWRSSVTAVHQHYRTP